MLLADDPAYAFMPYPAVPVPNASTGPLSGLTLGVKDLFDVAGYPTSGGSPHVLALSGIKTRTAPTAQRLLDAGARFVGKTITDELAFSLTGHNAHFGTPVNGAAPDRIPGGSSSGSASAVSNGLVDVALGTDTGGSVRTPASHCGLIGLRPTHGAISLEGAIDLAPSFDTCGWFARTMPVFARVADVLLGPAPATGTPRLMIARDVFARLEPEPRAALAPAIARVEAVFGKAAEIDVIAPDPDTLYWAFRHLQGREAWRMDGALIERHRLQLGPGVRERFEWSKTLTDAEVDGAARDRAAFRAHMDALLGEDGLLILPTMPDVAPLLTTPESALETYRNVGLGLLCLAGLSGVPQLSLPLATRLGAPFGLSLIGPRGSDRRLIALAERVMA